MKKKESVKRLPRKAKKAQKKLQEKTFFQQLTQQPMMARVRRSKDGDAAPASGNNGPSKDVPVA